MSSNIELASKDGKSPAATRSAAENTSKGNQIKPVIESDNQDNKSK